MHRRGWLLSTEMIFWHSLALASICLGIGLFSYRALLRPLEVSLPREAMAFAAKMGHEVSEPLWLLDSRAVGDVLDRERVYPDLLGIRVEDQFGETLAGWRTDLSKEAGLTVDSPVYYRKELIGRVHVIWSRQPILSLRAGLWPAILAISVCGIATHIVLTAFLTRRFLHKPLYSVMASMRDVAQGRFAVAMPTARHSELRMLLSEAKRMAVRIHNRTAKLNAEIEERNRIEVELVQHRNQLEEIVQMRTRELVDVNRSLRKEMEQRKRVQRAIINVSTYEQQRIGQDLHDTLGQEIAGARFMLASLDRMLANAAPQCIERTKELSVMLRDIMEHARMLAHGLMVVDLREGGLSGALKSCADKATALFSVECHFVQDCVEAPVVEAAAAVQLYYIVQESINNAIKHGNASKIRIRLECRKERPVLQIVDNGDGFVTDTVGGGMGLCIMRSRAESIGVELTVWSKPGRGTCIRCRI